MKNVDIAKGVQSYEKKQIGQSNQLNLAELQDADNQEAAEITVGRPGVGVGFRWTNYPATSWPENKPDGTIRMSNDVMFYGGAGI